MKKILSLILCGVLVLGTTGCGDDSSDNKNDETKKDKTSDAIKEDVKKEIALECSGDYLFNFGFIVGKEMQSLEESEPEKIHGYYFDDANGIGNGEYRFVFENEKIVKMTSIETMNLTSSKQVSDADIKEEDESMEDCTLSRNNNGNVVIKCEFNTEDDYVKALNLDSKTSDDLKKILEDNTELVCK